MTPHRDTSHNASPLVIMSASPRQPSREPVADSRRSTHSPKRRKENLAALKGQLTRAVAGRRHAERSRLKLEQGLREVRELFETAFGDAPIGMALVDMKGGWLQVNGALCRITGFSSAELKATTLQAITHPEDAVEFAADEMNSARGRSQLPGREALSPFVGPLSSALLTVSVVRDGNGRALYVINQIQDISERKERARQLEYLVDHDFLTGLYNRRWFERELGREVERAARYGTPGAVLVIDLDYFKEINDGFGHQAGDDLLKGVAGLLKQRARQSDVLARLGGDEFALLLPQTSPDRAELVADEIVKTLNRRMPASAGQSLAITASVGVAISDGLTNTELLAYADLAMYEAKEAGRNRFAVYRPIKGERTSARLAEAERIRHALEDNALLLYGQPVLDFQTNTLHNYELLVRLPGDNGGAPLLPSAFLYVAERFGLIQAVDAWVARTAMQLIADQERAGRRLVLSVNLSGKSICDPAATGIEEALDATAIDPDRLIFRAHRRRRRSVISSKPECRDPGLRAGAALALDDFGRASGRSTTSRTSCSTTSRSTAASSEN